MKEVDGETPDICCLAKRGVVIGRAEHVTSCEAVAGDSQVQMKNILPLIPYPMAAN